MIDRVGLASTRSAALELVAGASGLERYWIGLVRLADSAWLDDLVRVDNVERRQRRTGRLLPRPGSVQVTDYPAGHPPAEGAEVSLEPGGLEPSAAFAQVRAHRDSRQARSGKLGGWTRLERRGEPWRLAVQQAVAVWQCESRPRLR